MKQTLGITSEEAKYSQVVSNMWERSNFQSGKYRLVRFGSNLGDAFLFMLPDALNKPVLYIGNSEDWTPIYDPHDRDTMTAAKQSYMFVSGDGKQHTWDRIFWPDRVETYIDEKLTDQDAAGNVITFDHGFGVVPVWHVRNIDIGEEFGACSWANVQPKIDNLNEMASYLRSIIYRYAEPTLIGKNIRPGSVDDNGKPVRVQKGTTKNGTQIIYVNGDERAELVPLEFQGNPLPQVLENIRDLYTDIKDDLPELALSKLRDQVGPSGYSVNLQLSDAIAKIAELRGSYGEVLEWINQVAIRYEVGSPTAALEEFQNSLVFEPVLPVDEEGRISVWEGEKRLNITSRRQILREKGLSDEEIDKRLKEIDEDMQQDIYNARLAMEASGQGEDGSEGDNEGNQDPGTNGSSNNNQE
jgi:hypothetical protein